MNRKTSFAALALLLIVAGSVHAHPFDPSVDHRQARQHHRIAGGVHSGALTRHEVHRLAREQAAIRAEERRYRADGHLSAWERADLHRDLNRANRHIWRESHDRQRRF